MSEPGAHSSHPTLLVLQTEEKPPSLSYSFRCGSYLPDRGASGPEKGQPQRGGASCNRSRTSVEPKQHRQPQGVSRARSSETDDRMTQGLRAVRSQVPTQLPGRSTGSLCSLGLLLRFRCTSERETDLLPHFSWVYDCHMMLLWGSHGSF